MSSESECLVGGPPNESQLLVFKTSILASSLRGNLTNGSKSSQHEHESKDISTLKADGDEMRASVLKMTYKFTLIKPKILETLLRSHGFEEAENLEKCNFIWTNQHLEPAFYKSLLPFQRISHFPRYFDRTMILHFIRLFR